MCKLFWMCICMVSLTIACEKDVEWKEKRREILKLPVGDTEKTRGRCLTDSKMAQLYEARPTYLRELMEGRQSAMAELERSGARNLAAESVLTVPVHVIVVHRTGDAPGSRTNITEARIKSQIEALNRDFRRLNNDASKTPGVFKTGDSRIQFCLASIDPAGKPTNGISRHATNRNFDNNEISIKRATRWDPTRYLNIWVAPDIDALGYAYLPTPNSLPNADEDGVVVLTEAFGGPQSGAEAPFNLGRTLTHEVGHYLGLDHIWGDGCRVDDGIGDTPNQARENYGCLRHPSPSCGNAGDMFMNYMDYTDDHCMNAFTIGQATFMRRILSTSRARLITPGRTACDAGPTPAPTCSDGLQNGDETGVDCGGSCPPCQSAPTVDAGLASLTYTLTATQCDATAVFTVRLTNHGSEVLRSATIELRSAAGSLLSHSWTGTLASKASRNVTFGEVTLAAGQHQVTARVRMPNGKVDGNASNDQAVATVQVASQHRLQLAIRPDDYGSDISWEIRDAAGKRLFSGGGYDDFDRSQKLENICLPEGCYRLIMRDSYGDGICCDYGRGWYELRAANGRVLFRSDGNYGRRETRDFCIDGRGQLARDRVESEPKSLQLNRRDVNRAPATAVRN